MSKARTFVVSGEQMDRVLKFHPACHARQCEGVCGNYGSYTFTPTTIGDVLIYTCICGETLNISDFENW